MDVFITIKGRIKKKKNRTRQIKKELTIKQFFYLIMNFFNLEFKAFRKKSSELAVTYSINFYNHHINVFERTSCFFLLH